MKSDHISFAGAVHRGDVPGRRDSLPYTGVVDSEGF